MTPSTPIAPFISLTSLFVTVAAKYLIQGFSKFVSDLQQKSMKMTKKIRGKQLKCQNHDLDIQNIMEFKEKHRAFEVFKHSLNTQGEKTQ